MKIEQVAVGKLKAYERNSRTHSAEQVAQIAASIREFGFTNPVLIDEGNTIIAGHGRLLAAQSLGLDKVPCVRLVGLSEAQRRAYVIADNQIALNSGWDADLLNMELAELDALDFDLSLTGFDQEELDGMLALADVAEPQCDEDEAPPVSSSPVSKIGDVWSCGRHRVICADSTDAGCVKKVMGGGMASAVLTDPPYGINQPGVPGDSPEDFANLMAGYFKNLPMVNGVCVTFQSPRMFVGCLDALRQAGFKFERMLWMYKQAQMVKPWRGWLLKSEAILVASVGEGVWNEVKPYVHDCYLLSEVSGELDSDIGWHGSVKPQKVVADILSRISIPGGVVFDGFLGSGSTLIACEKSGRICRGMELAPGYVDVIVRRWQQFTGRLATLDGDGRTFDEISQERLGHGGN